MTITLPFSYRSREQRRTRCSKEPVDLLVIGGGITGTGIARDAAMRGLSTALLEREDFAHGTSSRSSKLIHGGLRYLEHFEFALVREARIERKILLKLAPHLVKPLPFIFPVRAGDKHGRIALKIGLTLYDFLGRKGGPTHDRHHYHGKKKLLSLEPRLNPAGLKGGFLYFDAFVDDARLTLENARSAHRQGATVLNYVEATKIEQHPNQVIVHCRDRVQDQSFMIQARQLVLAGGPWTDQLRQLVSSSKKPILRPSIGSHLVFPKQAIPHHHAIVMTTPDGRITFAIPWRGYSIVGTTDLDAKQAPDSPAIRVEEADYLLAVVNRQFTKLALTRADIQATYAGIRPLIAGHSSAVGSTSREFVISEEAAKIWSIAGGKYTTYRAMAETMVDRVIDQIRREEPTRVEKLAECQTAHVSFRKTPGTQTTEALRVLLPSDVVEHLCEAYQDDSDLITHLITTDSSLAERMMPGLPFIYAEVVYCVEQESAMQISDLLRRRIPLYFRAVDQGVSVLPRVSDMMGERLGWSEATRREQIAAYQHEVAAQLAFRSS